jgi:hypothetical protein
MAEVMSMIPDETPAGELNADEQESLQVGEQMEQEQDQRLAGKYKNAEELEAAYLELQKKLGEQPEDKDETVEDTNTDDTESILDRLWNESQTEFNPETVEALTKTDPVQLAEMYLQYRSSQEENNQSSVISEQDVSNLKGLVGGENQYNEMLGWASQNLSEQDIEMYDAVMELGNPAAARFAIEALAYRYQESNGVEPDLVQGKSPGVGAAFRSQSEVVQAMSDPRYDNDPAYRRDVMKKLERSNIQF